MSGTEALIWREWDGDTLVYHPLSGDTQRLDIASAEILRVIAGCKVKRNELLDRLAAFLEVEKSLELDRAVSQILGKLDDLGIIEPVYE